MRGRAGGAKKKKSKHERRKPKAGKITAENNGAGSEPDRKYSRRGGESLERHAGNANAAQL